MSIRSYNIDFATSDIALTFKTGSTTTGTGTATLVNIGNGIGILTYRGNTGWNDGGSGNRDILVEFDAGFQTIIGGAVDSAYAGMPGAYQAYSNIFKDYIDNYVVKPDATQKMRIINFVIFGKFI